MKLLILTDIKVGHLKDVADAAYYPLSENNDGTKILKEDVENFITDVHVTTIGEKTTVVNAHTRSGFDTVRHSSCVDPKNYSEELGKQYAMEEVVNDLWAHLGFVLQWAKYGINVKPKESKYSPHIQRVITEYEELKDKKCNYNPCSLDMRRLCTNRFVEGYTKGYTRAKKDIKERII